MFLLSTANLQVAATVLLELESFGTVTVYCILLEMIYIMSKILVAQDRAFVISIICLQHLVKSEEHVEPLTSKRSLTGFQLMRLYHPQVSVAETSKNMSQHAVFARLSQQLLQSILRLMMFQLARMGTDLYGLDTPSYSIILTELMVVGKI